MHSWQTKIIMKSEIILYQSDERQERIEVWIENDTVWLSQQQMSMLLYTLVIR